jgi:hypothetical protein
MIHKVLLGLLLFAAAGAGAFALGWRAWREVSLELDHRIEVSDAPEGVSGRRYRRIIRRQRRRKRLLRTVLWAALGAAAGVATVLVFALFRRR